jgi:antitoxin VapB
MEFETIEVQDYAGVQAIKIPENLKIKDNMVYIKKVGNCLCIIPYHQPWQSLFDSLQLFSDDFMDNRSQPQQQQRESFD